jgi:hypothetical protein
MSIMMLTFSTMPMMAAPLGAIADRTGASTLFIAQGVAVATVITLVSLWNWRYVVSPEPVRVDEEPAAVSAG